jgi:hypothetical protein
MESAKEYFLIMREQEFNALDTQTRALFTHVEVREASEWINNQDDPIYRKLYKEQQNAKKVLQSYLYDKRNNNKNK